VDPSSENQIIVDRKVLTADYLPNKMVHRDSERKQIASNLEPLLEGKSPIDMLVYGDPGTGKTAMSRYVIDELRKHEPQLKYAYINCFKHSTKFDIFYTLLNNLGHKMVHRQGTPTDEIVQKLEEVASKNKIVIVVDEVDQLTEDEVLYELSRFTRAGLIMIANQQTVFHDVDTRVRSRLSGRDEIRFKKYTENELNDILLDRREYGLRNNAVSKQQIRKIAIQSNGDARRAINTLRIAAQKAEQKKQKEIDEKQIKTAKPEAIKKQKQKTVEKLNNHQKILLEIIQNDNRINSTNLYEKYREKTEKPKSKRTLRRYLNKMENYNLIKSHGKGKGTAYEKL